MSELQCYQVYGFTFESSIAFPELLKSKRRAEVTIEYGSVPTEIINPTDSFYYYQTSPEQVLLLIPKIGRFLIERGEHITIEPLAGVSETSVRLYLLGYGLGILLLQRSYFPLHASVIAFGDSDCIAFFGPSGLGKSTLAKALQQRGFAILSDDLCVMDLQCPSKIQVFPGYPQIKLRENVAAMLEEEIINTHKANELDNKFYVTFKDGFCSTPRRLVQLFALEQDEDSSTTSIKPLRGIEKVMALVYNTYRLEMLKGMGLSARHFEMCSQIAQQLPISQIKRSANLSSLHSFVDLILQYIEQSTAS